MEGKLPAGVVVVGEVAGDGVADAFGEGAIMDWVRMSDRLRVAPMESLPAGDGHVSLDTTRARLTTGGGGIGAG